LWTRVRRGFRWFRILALLSVLAVAGFLFYWHQTGLPDFVKNALLEALRHRGLDLQFASLHFRWDRGLVAHDVSFGRDQLIAGPQLSAREVQIVLDAAAALRGQLQVNLLRLRDGRIVWRFANGPQATPPLEISRLQTEMAIHEAVWELRHFNGEFLGAEFRIHGLISNALAFSRQWAEAQTPSTSGPSAAARAHLFMRDFAQALTNYHFNGPRTAELSFHLDALDWNAARLELRAQVESAQTPWGHGEHLTMLARRAPDNQIPYQAQVELDLRAAWLSNRWGKVEKGHLTIRAPTTTNAWWNTNLQATLKAGHLATPTLQASQVQATLQFSPVQTNLAWQSSSLHCPWATSGPVKLLLWSPLASAQNPPLWKVESHIESLDLLQAGRARQCRLTGEVQLAAAWPPTPQMVQGQSRIEEWHTGQAATGKLALAEWKAWWATNAWESLANTNLLWGQRAAPLELQWHLTLATSRLDQLTVEWLDHHGAWKYPLLTLTNLQARLAQGELAVSGDWNVEKRILQAHLTSTCNLHEFAGYLPPAWQNELRAIQWNTPPHLAASFTTTLPDWPKPPTNALADLAPATAGHLSLQLGPAQWRNLALSALAVRLEWDGHHLRVPTFEARAGDNLLKGTLEFSPEGDLQTQMDWKGLPDALIPLLPPTAPRALAMWKWEHPPELQLQLRGNWRQADSWQATGEVRTARFAFRDVPFESLVTRFSYASNVLCFHQPLLRQKEGQATAQKVEVDFNAQMVFLKEARGTVDPMHVAQAIGPHVVKTLAPYRFGGPVKAEVSGDIPMHGELGARVDFQIAGSPFTWWRFNASNVTTTILWRDETVTLTNLWADFYGGRLRGDLSLDFSSHQDTAMDLRFSLSQVQFAGLMADISDRTNRVEGLLTGHLNAQARANDWKSWNGFGNVSLTDGLIWEIPIFGLFSPVLNAISPGLGNSRAREAHGSFVIRDSVIRTEDLVIQAAGYNLKYRGTVNFDYEVDARVEAEVLRETKMLGPALSLFFKPFTKLFEYRVTGTLAHPKTKPVYIPGFLMKLLTPFRSLRELFQSDSEVPTTSLPAPPSTPSTPSEKPTEQPQP
jgi:hypothetical protein